MRQQDNNGGTFCFHAPHLTAAAGVDASDQALGLAAAPPGPCRLDDMLLGSWCAPIGQRLWEREGGGVPGSGWTMHKSTAGPWQERLARIRDWERSGGSMQHSHVLCGSWLPILPLRHGALCPE